MTAAYEIWANQYSDLPLFDKNPQQTRRDAQKGDLPKSRLKKNQAYPALVRSAKMVRNQNNQDAQIEIDFEVNDDSKHRVWLTLPMQESDLARDKQQVAKWTVRRMEDVRRIYSIACPYDYAMYDTKQVGEKGNVYFDFQGEPMDAKAFDSRKEALEGTLKTLVQNLHDRVGERLKELEGAQLFIVVVPNERNQKYPYTNMYGSPPRKYPMADQRPMGQRYHSADPPF